MIPTITKKFQNVVISTGNIISPELGRKTNEELFDGLEITLLNLADDPTTERVVVDIDESHGQVQRATTELTNKLSENKRNEISIGAKIFLNKNSPEYIQQAVDALLNILNVTYIDNVVLAYHPTDTTPDPVATATAAAAKATTSALKSPCDGGESNPIAAMKNWSGRNGAKAITELTELYHRLEQYALKQKITQLGIADLDAVALEAIHKTAKVAPTIAQVNLSTCCVVPEELKTFCTTHDIQLNTHSDPEHLLPDDQFANLAPGFKIDWSLRYQVHVRCRGVLTAKGYIVGASRPRQD